MSTKSNSSCCENVKGQEHVKRAFEVAAAGSHNVLMIGPPEIGKTLLARSLPGVLPTMSLDEAFEVTHIYSVADLLPSDKPRLQSNADMGPSEIRCILKLSRTIADLVGSATTEIEHLAEALQYRPRKVSY